ncbi:MAG: proprotein convertase P-domain-containing protein, partial [Candidatus Omnitrophica bacterium]|nr:proprotein convertase P-domain-containing protein [Candidatus Omnitrophota bacterium]
DAGQAVELARHWRTRPPLENITLVSTNLEEIHKDGLRLRIAGPAVPPNLVTIACLPSSGPHADTPTASLPLVDVGLATNSISIDLTNKAALIERGTNTFVEKIDYAAQAGAAFAVVYNFSTNVNTVEGGDRLVAMVGTDFVPIPAVFIGHSDGEALKALFETQTNTLAQVSLDSANYTFAVTNTWLVEHVGLRVMADCTARGDLRITLLSPMGTRSILQQYNLDTNAGPADWTYYSTHHFFESSAGNWTASITDEGSLDATGRVLQTSLVLDGVAIADTDHDGLDDQWEIEHFGNLDQGPKDDPDHDGYSNMREQIMATDPNAANRPLELNLSPWKPGLARLSWPSTPYSTYTVWSGTNVTSMSLITNLPGGFPETEWFVPSEILPGQFFKVGEGRD